MERERSIILPLWFPAEEREKCDTVVDLGIFTHKVKLHLVRVKLSNFLLLKMETFLMIGFSARFFCLSEIKSRPLQRVALSTCGAVSLVPPEATGIAAICPPPGERRYCLRDGV